LITHRALTARLIGRFLFLPRSFGLGDPAFVLEFALQFLPLMFSLQLALPRLFDGLVPEEAPCQQRDNGTGRAPLESGADA
jgi:hypothetical protein